MCQGEYAGVGNLKRLTDGNIISAMWIEGEIVADSVVYMADDSKYIGPLRNWKPHGNGVMYFPDGSWYNGMFNSGEIKGRGMMIRSNGDQYNGEFKNTLFNGTGTYITKQQQIYRGRFKEGCYLKKNGNMYLITKLLDRQSLYTKRYSLQQESDE